MHILNIVYTCKLMIFIKDFSDDIALFWWFFMNLRKKNLIILLQKVNGKECKNCSLKNKTLYWTVHHCLRLYTLLLITRQTTQSTSGSLTHFLVYTFFSPIIMEKKKKVPERTGILHQTSAKPFWYSSRKLPFQVSFRSARRIGLWCHSQGRRTEPRGTVQCEDQRVRLWSK